MNPVTDLFAGLDVGTTNIKCVLFDVSGQEVRHLSRPTPWASRRGGVELEATDLVNVAVSVVSDVCRQVDARVHALGVTGMAESGIVLDKSGVAVAPVVAWNDRRAETVAPSVYERIGHDEFVGGTGLPAGDRNTLVKLCWEREAGTGLDGGVGWLGVPEAVAHRLGADRVAERSLASRTGFYDVLADRWVPHQLAAYDLKHIALPELVDAGTPVGSVRGVAPQLDGAVIVIGGHDHLCTSIGVNAVGDGDVVDSMGTGEAISRTQIIASFDRSRVREFVGSGLTVGRHPLTGRLAVSAGLGSGLVLKRALNLVGVEPDGPQVADRLESLGRAALAVTRVPELRQDLVTGDWTVASIPADATAASLWRAALDLVGGRARHALHMIDIATGAHERVVACGGWLRDTAVRETKRAAIGGYECSPVTEPGALGAAVLGARAAGWGLEVPPARPVAAPEGAAGPISSMTEEVEQFR